MVVQTKPITVKLTREHTHAGECKQAGESIVVSQAVADWLIKNQIGSVAATNPNRRKKHG